MEVTFNGVLIGFVLTAVAGLATAIGSVIAFFTKTTNTKFLASALGFSAGVMIYISFVVLDLQLMTLRYILLLLEHYKI